MRTAPSFWFKILRWRIRRQRRRESLARIRKAIVIAGRSGIIRCNTISKPPRIIRRDDA